MSELRPSISPRQVSGSGDTAGGGHLFLREEQIRQTQEMLFLAWHDLTLTCDALLEELELGRAHQRILQFVGRRPGMTVGDLLAILRVTKQSLARALSDLQTRGLVELKAGRQDRRQRLLSLTAEGRNVEQRLFDCQRERLVAAYRGAGVNAVEGFRRVLTGIMDEESKDILGAEKSPRNVRKPTI